MFRSSVLGRVIWGSDLRNEREARLVLVGSKFMSPQPTGVKPDICVAQERNSGIVDTSLARWYVLYTAPICV